MDPDAWVSSRGHRSARVVGPSVLVGPFSRWLEARTLARDMASRAAVRGQGLDLGRLGPEALLEGADGDEQLGAGLARLIAT